MLFFFFKQMTAYEMRISDWSSDVCSSDLYAMEVKRQLDVLDRQLAEHEYIAGSDYTIADMAIWPWYGALAKGLVYDAGEFLQVDDYKNVQRWKIGRETCRERGWQYV